MSKQANNNGLYGVIFNSPVAEIDFMEIIQASNSPIIDLRPLRGLSKLDCKTRLPEIMLKPFLDLTEDLQDQVIFIANKNDIEALIENAPFAKAMLLRNPSIIQIMTEK